MYKKIYDPFTKENSTKFIFKCSPIPIWISMHPDNTDYQAYLKWLEEGNTPLPAEEQV
jgi:hypothetical protein